MYCKQTGIVSVMIGIPLGSSVAFGSERVMSVLGSSPPMEDEMRIGMFKMSLTSRLNMRLGICRR